MAVALAGAAVLMLLPAAHAALGDAEQMLHRSSADGTLPRGLASLHTRFGTPARAVDVTVAAMILVVLASGGRVAWLARAYAIAIAVMLVLTIAALVRLRRTRQGPMPFKAPGNLRIKGRELPLGLLAPARDRRRERAGHDSDRRRRVHRGGRSHRGLGALVHRGRATRARPSTSAPTRARSTCCSPPSSRPTRSRPVPATCWCRSAIRICSPTSSAALQTPGDRDVVVMTARLLDVDVSEESAGQTTPTPYERRLLSDVVALAERVGRPVRLLIVPTRNVVDAIVGTVIRLRSSDVYVGESSTLSAEDQARLLGEAWERADKPEALDVRLVIYHRSGRADTYHLGAHPPSLTSGDLDLIHRLWLDAVKTVGPHVHHDDVVRAALKQMEQQLTGPQRDEAVAAIRDDGAARRGARGGASRPRLRAAARHAAQSARRRRRLAADGAQPRRPGGRLPRAAAEGCRGACSSTCHRRRRKRC